MNRKIFDFIITVLSAIGAFYTILNNELIDLILHFSITKLHDQLPAILFKLVTIAILILIVYFLKGRFANLIDVLHVTGRNNKLDTLRAMVMVNYDQIKNGRNRFRIDNAEFKYKVTPTLKRDAGQHAVDESGEPIYSTEITETVETAKDSKVPYNVHLSCDFSFAKPWYAIMSGKQRVFSFYIICKRENVKDPKAKITVNATPYEVVPSYMAVTTRGESGDRIIEASGLQKAQIAIPEKVTCCSVLHISYSYNFTIEINNDSKQYNFVIIPMNYGRRIKKMSIEVDLSDTAFSPVLQCVDKKGEMGLAESFVIGKSNTYSVRLKPNMKTAYFIQIEAYEADKAGTLINSQAPVEDQQ